MYPNHPGCFRIGRVRIIDNQNETFSAVGGILPRKWRRDIFTLAGVLRGNVFCWNAGDFRVMAMAAFPHRIISEAAKRITASLEFRSGDTPPRSVMNSRRFIRSPRLRWQAIQAGK